MADVACARNTSFSFFLISVVMTVVAFATTHWSFSGNNYKIENGLWKFCVQSACTSWPSNFVADEFQTTRVMMCFAIIFYGIAFILFCVWLSKDANYLRQNGAGGVGKGALALGLVGALCQLVAVLVFGIYYRFMWRRFDYSFYNACAACGLMLITCLSTLGTTACCFKSEPPLNNHGTGMTIITSTTQPAGQGPVAYTTQPAGQTSAYATQPVGSAPGAYPNAPAYPKQNYASYPVPPKSAYPIQQWYNPGNAAYQAQPNDYQIDPARYPASNPQQYMYM